MKKAAIVLFVLALAVPVAFAGQEENTAVKDFSRSLRSDGITLTLVYLNDKTVEALFQAPTKYAMRAQARSQTMIYVQGTTTKELDSPTTFTLEQAGEVIEGTPHNIKNFEAGKKIAKGERIDGIVAFSKKLDLTKPFKVTNGKSSVEFKFSGDLVRSLSN